MTILNRHERRAAAAQLKAGLNIGKFRCLSCMKIGKKRNKEHFWPKWLIKFAEANTEKVGWIGGKVLPESCQIPLCEECNLEFSARLESPCSIILPKISNGNGITDDECETLVRWLWKFEGLFWSAIMATRPGWNYSAKYTLRDRVTGQNSLKGIRGDLVLAVGLAYRNDEDSKDWSLGVDSGVTDHDAIYVSCVFRNVALIVSLAQFESLIPSTMSKYFFPEVPKNSDDIVLVPEFVFPRVSDAEAVMLEVSIRLKIEHERWARQQDRRGLKFVSKPRIQIPHPNVRRGWEG